MISLEQHLKIIWASLFARVRTEKSKSQVEKKNEEKEYWREKFYNLIIFWLPGLGSPQDLSAMKASKLWYTSESLV